MTRVRLLAARVVAPLLLLAAPASSPAALVQANDDQCAIAPCVVEMTVSAAAGERNDMRIARDGDGVVVRDPGATLVAGRNCVRREDGSVRCALARPITQFSVSTDDGDDALEALLGDADHLSVYLGPGADRFTGDAKVLWLQAEEGDDAITGTGTGELELRGQEGDDVLTGGSGDDELWGGPGRDTVNGGNGDDLLHGFDLDSNRALDADRPEADVLDGDAGADEVSYRERRGTAVDVDLSDPAPDGSPGEGDVLRDVENVRGTDLGDRLRGDAAGNRLVGDGGVDVLEGLGGDDRLRTGTSNVLVESGTPPGPERAIGGDGDDDLSGGAGGAALLSGGDGDDVLRPGRRGIASCGAGLDLVRGTLWAPRISTACERWTLRVASTPSGPIEARLPHPRVLGGAVRLTVPCPGSESQPCTLRLRVDTPSGRRLAEARATAPAGTRRTLVARLPAAARRSGGIQAKVSVLLRRPGYLRPFRGAVRVTLR